jgi:hypothetical protein
MTTTSRLSLKLKKSVAMVHVDAGCNFLRYLLEL